jgi:hypothetical protein
MKKKRQTKPKDISTRTGKGKRGKVATPSEKPVDDAWERLLRIREKLGQGPQSEKSSLEILSEMRR